MAGTVHPAENPLLVQQAEQEAGEVQRQLKQIVAEVEVSEGSEA